MNSMHSNNTGDTPHLAGLEERLANTPRRLKESEAVEACFLWIDDESGDELVVEAQGSASFFAQLEALGFVPHVPRSREASTDGPAEGEERRGELSGVRRSARLDMASSGPDALPELWSTRLGA